MGNSTSKNRNKFKHSRSRSEVKIKSHKHKHKYRARSPETAHGHDPNNTEKIKFDFNDNDNANVSKNVSKNVRRMVSLNDMNNMNKPTVNKQYEINNMNIIAAMPLHSLATPQISASINNSNSCSDSRHSRHSPPSSRDNSNIATLTTNDIDITFKSHNSHNIQESDSSVPNYCNRVRAFSSPKQYSHRLQNSASTTICTTYTSIKKENKTKTPTLPDPEQIEDFGLDDDDDDDDDAEACKSYLSPSPHSIEAEPVPKSMKSIETIHSIHSIPLSAISKMSVTVSDEEENELSQSSSESLLQRANNPNRKPINFQNYYSEPDKASNYPNAAPIKRRKSINYDGNGLIKVRSTPNLKMAMHHKKENNNSLLLVINDNKTHFVDVSDSQDEEIKREQKVPTLGQSLSLNINDANGSNKSPSSISSTGAVILSPLMAVVTDKLAATSPRLRLLRSKSDILSINHHAAYDYERRYKNNQQRKYRSKYSGHYKICLATSKTMDVIAAETQSQQHGHMQAMRRGRSNSEDSVNGDNRLGLGTHKQSKSKFKKKDKHKKGKKRQSQSEKYKDLKSGATAGGIMHHFRSRSHSLANINKSNNKNRRKRKKKKKERGKHEYTTYKCINGKGDENGNGILDIYITETFAMQAYKFWSQHICTLNEREFRECATLFFSHLMADSETDSKILMRNNNIIEAPLKYFDMIGWLFRLLIDKNVNGYLTLKEIGKIHLLQYNISIASYHAMLNALHVIFTEICPQKQYTMKLRYIYDIVFISACFLMNGNKMDANHSQCLIQQKYDTLNSLYFLQSLDICLFDEIGCEYLYHFLHQSYCEEIPKFLVLYNKFKHCNPQNHRLKYKISNTIYEQCIADSSQFQINVPFATYQQIKVSINNINHKHVENDIFDVAYQQIKRLLHSNHWTNFKNILQSVRKQGQIGK